MPQEYIPEVLSRFLKSLSEPNALHVYQFLINTPDHTVLVRMLDALDEFEDSPLYAKRKRGELN